jgi:YcaO-like protein with predicted kinase domain
VTALDVAADAAEARQYAADRAVDPAVTLARVQPLLRPMGITRVANITGLDHVGLPVVNVVRPNARSNAVSQGKGLNLEAAMASGVMEAIETHCAEHVLKPLKLASAAEMAHRHRLPDLAALPRPRGSRFDLATPLLWIEGRDIQNGEAVWVPFELVHMNFTSPAPPGSGHFLLSSNGLASGNLLEEALGHGLCELIERDAGALFDLDERLIDVRRVDLNTIDDPYCCAIIDRLQAADLGIAIWDLTSDIGIAAFRCHLMEPAGSPSMMTLPASGEGCHPRRVVALLRAITEAAQARLSVIAGVRDDIGPALYGRSDDPASLEAWWRMISANSGRRRFDSVPDQPLDAPADGFSHLLDRLQKAGLKQIITVDLSPIDAGAVAVVRVMIPGLQAPTEAACIPGRRAQEVLGKAA